MKSGKKAKKLTSIVWKEDKWFVAKTLEVEVASQGKTQAEALSNLKEAVELYFEGEEPQPELLAVEDPRLYDLSVTINA